MRRVIELVLSSPPEAGLNAAIQPKDLHDGRQLRCDAVTLLQQTGVPVRQLPGLGQGEADAEQLHRLQNSRQRLDGVGVDHSPELTTLLLVVAVDVDDSEVWRR